jgi:light-regulated signal transduction histidine kinase (bacteriophytochrome)
VNDDKRAGEVIQGLRLLLKKGEMRLGPLDVNDVMRDVLRLVHSDMLNSGVGLSTRLAPDLPLVAGDRVQLQQVVLNLVVNGCDAMAAIKPADRRLVVSTETDMDGVRISVADRGCGIPPDGLERVFEAFFTTKAQGARAGPCGLPQDHRRARRTPLGCEQQRQRRKLSCDAAPCGERCGMSLIGLMRGRSQALIAPKREARRVVQ